MIPLITGLIVLAAGLWASYLAPTFWWPFDKQQNAFYLLSMGLSILSLCPFHQLSGKIKAFLKIISFSIIVGAGVWSLFIIGEWIFLFIKTFFNYRSHLSYSDTMTAVYRFIKYKGSKMGYTWLGWLGTSSLIIIPVMCFVKQLLIEPLKELFNGNFKKSEEKGLEEGPWKGGFMEQSKLNVLKSNKSGLPLGIIQSRFSLKKRLFVLKKMRLMVGLVVIMS